MELLQLFGSCASNLRLQLFVFFLRLLQMPSADGMIFFFSPSTGLVDNKCVPHQRGHSLLDEDDHVHARSRPQEAEERLDEGPAGGRNGALRRFQPRAAAPFKQKLLFLPPSSRLCFDPEAFVRGGSFHRLDGLLLE